MAVNTGQPFCNTTDGYLCEGTDIKGGYFVIDKLETIIAKPESPLHTKGALCYVTVGTNAVPGNTFYRYTGDAWIVHNIPNFIICPEIPTTPDESNGIIGTPGNIGDIAIVVKS